MLWGWGFVPFRTAITNLQAQVDELRNDLDDHIAATTPNPEPEPEPVPFPGIQAAYDALPAGATELVVPAGTYTEELTLNRPGVEVRGADGVTITGRIRIAADNVTLRNLQVVEGANASPDYWGTIWSDGVDGVQIMGVSVTGSAWAGIALKGGADHLLSGVDAYANGAVGIRLESVGSAVVTACTMRGNNTRGLDPGWEAGGLKATGNYGGISNVTVENCQSYGNDGPGIWFDVDAQDCTIRTNTVHHNTRAGIIYELSAFGSITNNVIYENGWGFRSWGFGAGILIQNSADCAVSDNVLAWNGDGIVVISQDRGEARWNEVMRNQVDSNVIAHEDDNEQWGAFAAGVLEDWGGVATGPLSHNSGIGNQYYFTRWDESEPSAGNGVWILRGRNGSEGYYGVPEVFDGVAVDQSEIESILGNAGIPLEPER